MMIVYVILFDLALIYFVFGHSIVRKFYPKDKKTRALLKDLERHLRHLLRRDRDILSAEHQSGLSACITELRSARTSPDPGTAAACLERYQGGAGVDLPPKKGLWLREHIEILVVALGLAFGVRALFLQPFKIPTGSMQPTLFGIHFVQLDDPVRANPLKRAFDYVNYSRRYVDVVVERSGRLRPERVRAASPSIPFFPSTIIDIAGVEYRLPGTKETVQKYIRFSEDNFGTDGLHFNEGDVLARGYLVLGDHLFVDRTRLAFTEPKRGEVTVFVTDGIKGMGGHGLGGRYYIKRLVGLPGDELAIRDHKLYVKRPGDADFQLADDSIHPGFERMYTYQGGYRGYSHYPFSRYLTNNGDTFTVPENRYFMLGDNSENSRDSRFWGTVPRENLVGRALFVWWPFSRRWGLTDRVAPEEFASPPTMPALPAPAE
jgi:signal peptidase I